MTRNELNKEIYKIRKILEHINHKLDKIEKNNEVNQQKEIVKEVKKDSDDIFEEMYIEYFKKKHTYSKYKWTRVIVVIVLVLLLIVEAFSFISMLKNISIWNIGIVILLGAVIGVGIYKYDKYEKKFYEDFRMVISSYFVEVDQRLYELCKSKLQSTSSLWNILKNTGLSSIGTFLIGVIQGIIATIVLGVIVSWYISNTQITYSENISGNIQILKPIVAESNIEFIYNTEVLQGDSKIRENSYEQKEKSIYGKIIIMTILGLFVMWPMWVGIKLIVEYLCITKKQKVNFVCTHLLAVYNEGILDGILRQ